MIEHILATGTSGELKVEDNTDDPNLMTVNMWVRSTVAVSVPQLPWTFDIDEIQHNWRSFNFQAITDWQLLGRVFVGSAQGFTLRLGDTGTLELNGPTDLAVNLYGGSIVGSLVNVKMEGVYKKATAYVRDGGVWKIATPFVKTPSGWVEIV